MPSDIISPLLMACGILLALGSIGAAVMSYASNVFIAVSIGGWDDLEAHIYPLVVDAPVMATAIGVLVLGMVGVTGGPVRELAVLTLLAAILSLSGNALHGPMSMHLLAIPWPWNLWASLLVSAVPVLCICVTAEVTRLLLAQRVVIAESMARGRRGQQLASRGSDGVVGSHLSTPGQVDRTPVQPRTLSRGGQGQVPDVDRARALLSREPGLSNTEAARRLSISVKTVSRARKPRLVQEEAQ